MLRYAVSRFVRFRGLQAFYKRSPECPSQTVTPLHLPTDLPIPELHRRAHHLEHAVRRRQLVAAVQRLRVAPPAGRHHVHERHVLSLGGPLPSERMELTALHVRQTRMPLHAGVQPAEDLPRPVIVFVDAREQPPLANHRELHLEAAQLLGQRLGNGNDAITAPLIELRPELDLGRIETDVRPTEAANRPNPRPSCFREHERHFPPLPAVAPALLWRRRRQVLGGLPELQKPVIRRDRATRVLFLRQLHAAKWVVLEQPRTVRQPLDRKSTRLNSSHGYISYAV